MKVIDIHTHFTIENTEIASDAEKLGFAVRNKSVEEHLNFMNKVGIDFALLSCPTQKFPDDKERCAAYCRQVNLMGKKISETYLERFGYAVSLPLPFVDTSIEELRCAVSEGASAVCMCSNYNGMYLGDKRLEPLFDVLDELKCVVLLHPAAPMEYPKNPVTGKILPMFEFITDTTRTVLDIIDSETLIRHPNVKIVIPHSGSCLPTALDRFKGIMYSVGKDIKIPMNQFYFDLACDAFPHGVPILLTMTDSSHILYGTDYPAIPEFVLERHLSCAKNCPELAGNEDEILWKNACRIFRIRLKENEIK